MQSGLLGHRYIDKNNFTRSHYCIFQLGRNSRQVSRLSTLVMLETFRSRVYSRAVLGFL